MSLIIDTVAKQPSDADLTALADLATTGLIARTGAGTAATRSVVAPAAGITIANGDGVAGSPTLSLANDLAALEGLAANGLIARTGDGTASARTITQPAAGITVADGDGVAGNPTLALANDLAAVEGLSANGLATRTGDGTWSARTVTGTANQVTVTDGDGVAGNPTLSTPQDIAAASSPTFANVTLTNAWSTFTPTVTLVGGAGNTVPVYSTNTGRQRTLGKVVHAVVYLTGDGGAEGAGTGTINIALPTAASASNPPIYFPVGFLRNNVTDFPIFGLIDASGTTVQLFYFAAGTTITALDGDDQNSTTRSIGLRFAYEID
jgi:hypothetical protein